MRGYSMAGHYEDGKEDVILLACIGAQSYRQTIYVDKEVNPPVRLSESGYAFDAVVRKEKPNKIILIGTTSSFWTSLSEFYGKAEKGSVLDKCIRKCSEADLRAETPENHELVRKTCDAISEQIRGKTGFETVRIVLTPFGRNNAELTDYFGQVSHALSEMIVRGKKTKIVFDISNGFRSMPMFLMMLVKYLNLIEDTEINYCAYYGMFDAKFRASDDSSTEYTPLVNMRMVTDLSEWVNAISEFRSFGSVKMLLKCLEKEREEAVAEGETYVSKDDLSRIDSIIRTIREFEYGSSSNNLFYLQKSIREISVFRTEEYTFLTEPARLILQTIVKYFGTRFGRFVSNAGDGKEEADPFHYAYFQIRLAQMYTEQARYGAASIALCEGVTTYLIERYDSVAQEALADQRRLGEDEYVRLLFDYKFRDGKKVNISGSGKIALSGAHTCWVKCKNEGLKIFEKRDHKNEEKVSESISIDFAIKEKDNYGLEFLIMRIRDLIRNPQAHNLFSDLGNSFENVLDIDRWLYVSINSILADMHSKDRRITYDEQELVLPFSLYKFLTSE